MRSSGTARVNSGVERCGGSQTGVTQELADQFVGPRIGVEDDFCGEMPELMWSDFQSQIPGPCSWFRSLRCA